MRFRRVFNARAPWLPASFRLQSLQRGSPSWPLASVLSVSWAWFSAQLAPVFQVCSDATSLGASPPSCSDVTSLRRSASLVLVPLQLLPCSMLVLSLLTLYHHHPAPRECSVPQEDRPCTCVVLFSDESWGSCGAWHARSHQYLSAESNLLPGSPGPRPSALCTPSVTVTPDWALGSSEQPCELRGQGLGCPYGSPRCSPTAASFTWIQTEVTSWGSQASSQGSRSLKSAC